jgi:hypothetical protein
MAASPAPSVSEMSVPLVDVEPALVADVQPVIPDEPRFSAQPPMVRVPEAWRS